LVLQAHFPLFDPNDEHTTLLGREEIIEQVSEEVENIATADKFHPLRVTSTRGMGKTFLLKKICTESVGIFELVTAAKYGCVLSMECGLLKNELSNTEFLLDNFWHLVIYHHIFFIFHQRLVDGKNFSGLSIDQIIEILKTLKPSPQMDTNVFNWMLTFKSRSVSNFLDELIRLTTIAFKIPEKEKIRPVFLIDNAHFLLSTEFPNKRNTILSLLLIELSIKRPVCFVSVTNDGKLVQFSDFTSFIPVHLELKCLNMNDKESAENKNDAKNKKINKKRKKTSSAPFPKKKKKCGNERTSLCLLRNRK